jgi:hypothetical protein
MSKGDSMKVIKQDVGMKIGLPIDHLLKAIAERAEDYIGDGHEHQAQLFLLRRIEGGWGVDVIAVTPLPPGQDERDAMAQAMGHLVAPFEAYIELVEAYFTIARDREEVQALIGKVKDAPGRVEVFQLRFVTRDGKVNRVLTWEILRPTGERAHFGTKTDQTNEYSEGRFANLYLYSQGGKES